MNGLTAQAEQAMVSALKVCVARAGGRLELDEAELAGASKLCVAADLTPGEEPGDGSLVFSIIEGPPPDQPTMNEPVQRGETTVSDHPLTRLTRMGHDAVSTLDEHPEWRSGDKAVVCIQDGERGGIATTGYTDEQDAMLDMTIFLRTLFEANGIGLVIITPDDGEVSS